MREEKKVSVIRRYMRKKIYVILVSSMDLVRREDKPPNILRIKKLLYKTTILFNYENVIRWKITINLNLNMIFYK